MLFVADSMAGAIDAFDLGSSRDHRSLALRLRVPDAGGNPSPGRIDLDAAETRWRFTPAGPWPDAPHRALIDERPEDLGGKRRGRLFDQPLGTPASARMSELD